MRMMEDENRLLKKGRAEGKAEGEITGSLKTLISQTCSKLKKAKTPKVIADELEQTDIQQIIDICKAAEQCAPEYNVDKIYEILMQDKASIL